ncbi:Uncharacterised protein [Klebsiella pneumoniae]|nr:Uncharacterised protein [Klebsiella pneumoniae]
MLKVIHLPIVRSIYVVKSYNPKEAQLRLSCFTPLELHCIALHCIHKRIPYTLIHNMLNINQAKLALQNFRRNY